MIHRGDLNIMELSMRFLATLFVGVLASSLPAIAEKSDWAEGSFERNDGANREHYNRAAALPWKNFMGDWCDANDIAQGNAAFAIARIVDDDLPKPIEWNVTELAKGWIKGGFPNQGMLLRVVDGRGPIIFGSRENKIAALRPKLLLVGANGTVRLDPVADTYLTKSTYRSQGQAELLRVSATPDHLLIRFDLNPANGLGAISEAKLILQTTKQYGSTRIGVFRCNQGHDEPASDPVLGIAARYPEDRGIGEDADVIFATKFESPKWEDEWTQAEPKDKIDSIDPGTDFKRFKSLQGKALRSRIAKGSTTALNTLFKFRQQIGSEPEEVYFRYYLRLADDWNQTVQGGKLPGISGTYGRAGLGRQEERWEKWLVGARLVQNDNSRG